MTTTWLCPSVTTPFLRIFCLMYEPVSATESFCFGATDSLRGVLAESVLALSAGVSLARIEEAQSMRTAVNANEVDLVFISFRTNQHATSRGDSQEHMLPMFSSANRVGNYSTRYKCVRVRRYNAFPATAGDAINPWSSLLVANTWNVRPGFNTVVRPS